MSLVNSLRKVSCNMKNEFLGPTHQRDEFKELKCSVAGLGYTHMVVPFDEAVIGIWFVEDVDEDEVSQKLFG